MPRETIVKNTPAPTPEQQAREFAGRLESVSQAIGWLQTQDRDAVEAATAQVGGLAANATLPDLQRISEIVKRWQLDGGAQVNPILTAGVAAGSEGGGQTAPPSAASPGKTGTTGEESKHDGSPRQSGRAQGSDAHASTSTAPGKPKPWASFDYVAAADKFAAEIIAKAENEEAFVPAEILKLRDQVARLSHALLRFKQGEKTIKEKLELAVEALDSAEREKQRAEETPLPLIDAAEKAKHAENWRAVELVALGVAPGTVKKLAEHEPPLTTLGALTDWQTKKADFWANDIKGIGVAAEESIIDACDKYWAEHPPVDPSKAADLQPGPEAAVRHPDASPPPAIPQPMTDAEIKTLKRNGQAPVGA